MQGVLMQSEPEKMHNLTLNSDGKVTTDSTILDCSLDPIWRSSIKTLAPRKWLSDEVNRK